MEYQYGSEYEEWAKKERAEREAREKRYAALQPDPNIAQAIARSALSGNHAQTAQPVNAVLAVQQGIQITATQEIPAPRTTES